MEIKGLEDIINTGYNGKPAVYLSELMKESPIKCIDFGIDSYDAGFNIVLENGKIIEIRVSTMPSADTTFYIKQ